MNTTILKGMVFLAVALAAVWAQAATVAYWQFNEKTPGNPVNFTTGAIVDSGDAGTHDGTAYGGDPFADPDRPEYVYSRYVAGVSPENSALRMTLQDVPDDTGYVGAEEDVVWVPSSSAFNMDLTAGNVYTIEAVIRAPDPMEIINGDAYDAAFPQWYDYTDNTIVGRPSAGAGRWALRLTNSGHPSLAVQDGDGTWLETSSTATVTGGLWHHVAAKISGSTTPASRKVEFYIDGTKTNEASLSDVGLIASTTAVLLGSWQDEKYPNGERWSDEFVGDIDAIRISTGTVTFLPTPTNTVPALDVVHTGSADPNTEAKLRLCDQFYGEESGSSTWTPTPASGDDPASGRLQEAANSAAYYRALLSPEQLQDPTGWTVTATMKLGASNKPWNECLVVEDGTSAWVMNFMDGTSAYGAGVFKSGAFDFTGGAGVAHFTGVEELGDVDPTGDFHKYQMYYDPATDKVSFYVDAELVGEQTRAETWNRDPDGYASKCRLFFGDSYPIFNGQEYYTGDTASDAYWSDVRIETGDHIDVKELIYQPYDVNEDGFVGADDLDVVRAHWGESGPGGKAIGDINLDQFVGADDLDQLRAHWGEVCPPVPGLVPEPTTVVLLIMGGLAMLLRRRRR